MARKTLKIKYKIIYLSIFLASGSCGTDYSEIVEKYGHSNNTERKKLGLPIIPEDWKITRIDNQSMGFTKDGKYLRGHYKGHVSKVIFFNNEGIRIREVDSYYSGREIECVEPGFPDPEELEAHYSFVLTKYYNHKWQYEGCLLYDELPDSLNSGQADQQLIQIEGILKLWGIKRLNY